MLILCILFYVLGDAMMGSYWYMCIRGAGTGMGAGIVMMACYILWFTGIVLNIAASTIQTIRTVRFGYDEKWYIAIFGIIFLSLLALSYRSSVFR